MSEGIRKRSKSIKHNSWEFTVDRVYEDDHDVRIEKLQIKLKPSSHNAFIDLDIWEDRWVLVNCFERTKEEKWDWESQGRLLGNYSGKDFILAVQETSAMFFRLNHNRIHNFDTIWQPMLARGPKGVL